MSELRKLSVGSMFAFGLFGAFWGAWGASIPRIQRQTGVDDGQLGFALLFVGAAALPAMLLIGRAVDRYGLRIAGMVLPALSVTGAVMALSAHGLLGLCIGLAIIGAVSGASDVAINSVAGQAEVLEGGSVITRSHAAFSSLVVLASVATGICASISLSVSAPFLFLAAVSVLVGIWLVRILPHAAPIREPSPIQEPASPAPKSSRNMPLILMGILGALAFASENAHQSWSAVFAHDVLHTSTGVAAGAPAIFAAVVAVTRFAVGRVAVRYAVSLIVGGAVAATVGAGLIAAAPDLPLAVLGLALAAAGTAVLFPTLLRLVSRNVEESRRGRATSLVGAISYLGFLLGPVYVGQWADATGLRGAMLAVAGLGAVLVISAPALLRRAGMEPVASDQDGYARI